MRHHVEVEISFIIPHVFRSVLVGIIPYLFQLKTFDNKRLRKLLPVFLNL